MNRDSNKFIIIFASIMVIVVALLLSVVHEILKDTQQKNEDIDKMSQILRSIKIQTSGNDTEKIFNEMVTDMYLIDTEGNIIQDSKDDAFSADMKAEMDKSIEKRHLPVYVVTVEGQTKYILALYGKGLWGPLWGYISIDNDGRTIYGTDFSHQGETPGLGAEISQKWFSERFEGKQLFKEGQFKSVAVVKPGNAPSDKDYVDGISGGTITGNGVNAMLYDTLEGYSKFLSNLDK
ncbi:MAG: NADH:ubiquinone reductase (Na(+)-transporting) subunit C [Dysgonomonas sp.]|nr:NADH:ubiquinone reductase (Na(+)-transporting) subunit C [Dysgonomonas sp.]